MSTVIKSLLAPIVFLVALVVAAVVTLNVISAKPALASPIGDPTSSIRVVKNSPLIPSSNGLVAASCGVCNQPALTTANACAVAPQQTVSNPLITQACNQPAPTIANACALAPQQTVSNPLITQACGLVSASPCECGYMSNLASLNVGVDGGNATAVMVSVNGGSSPASVHVSFNGSAAPASVNVSFNSASQPAASTTTISTQAGAPNVSSTTNNTTTTSTQTGASSVSDTTNKTTTTSTQTGTFSANSSTDTSTSTQAIAPGVSDVDHSAKVSSEPASSSPDPKSNNRKGNNGVGNGIDPQPPGNPPINDGPGTSPGNPGNKGGAIPKSGNPAGGNSHALPSLPTDAE